MAKYKYFVLLIYMGAIACTPIEREPLLVNNRSEMTFDSYNTLPSDSSRVLSSVYPESTVTVPESYYLRSTGSPISHQVLDNEWVSRQNPQGYTIELAHQAKASVVANQLSKAPKNDRTAEVKRTHNGEDAYQGVYGSYSSYEAAQQALEKLPQELKEQAQIKRWDMIQQNAQ